MKNILHKSRLQYLLDSRNRYLFVAIISLTTNLLLCSLVYYVFDYEKIVIVPPNITREFWVSGKQVSAEYISSMSLFIADLRFNLTPSNASVQRQLLLRYVEPSQYEKLKMELMEQEEHLRKEHISMTIYITNIEVDVSKMVARVTGDLQYIVGESLQPVQHVVYRISYRLLGGRLVVCSIEEEKNHA